MLTLSPKLTARLPVAIDISRMKGQAEAAADAGAELPANAGILSQILELNPTASPEFLGQFSDRALTDYRDHLQSASLPRGRFARRVRPDNTPGVVCRDARA